MIIPRGIKPYLIGAAAAFIVAIIVYAYISGRRHQAATDAVTVRAAQTETENAIARSDSTHHTLRDSVDVAYRRAEQADLVAIQLADSIRLQRAVTTRLTIVVDTLRARVAAVVTTDSADTRYASFHERQGPITVSVDVTMPARDSARATIVASVTPPVIDIDAGCRAAAAGGVRSAYVAASAAGWGRVTIGRSVFGPDVCNAVPVIIRPSFGQRVRSVVPWLAAGVVAGIVSARKL